MHRRDFILGGVKVSLSFLALDALSAPLLGLGHGAAPPYRRPLRKIDLTRPPVNFDDSLDVIAAYLVQYGPPAGRFPDNGAWKATYDVIAWMGTPSAEGAAFSRRNRVMGRLAVTRRPDPAGAGVGYELDHAITLNGFVSTLSSTMRCSAGRLPGLVEWTTDYAMHSVRGAGSPLKLREQGRHRDGLLEILGPGGARRFPTDRPVMPQWAVLDALRGAKVAPSQPVAAVEFDLLHDLTSYRPHQRLEPCGVLELTLDGRPHTLHGFVQRGWGSEPTHYWIDAAGRPLLVTGGLGASALISIEAA